mgnify:CR=1 FL=1
MQKALEEAQVARRQEEIPVGAIIVCRGRIIARAHNMTETLNDPTAHAEMQAITSACYTSVSYTHLRAHETVLDLVCRLLLEKKKENNKKRIYDNILLANYIDTTRQVIV